MPGSKLKVVWICHFSNAEIRKKLPLSQKIKYGDFAAWITNLASGFAERKDIDLHIIAPHIGLKKFLVSVKENNINYHFYKHDVPFINKRWPAFFRLDAITHFLRNKILVNHFIREIKPDIINLHGAENPHYSSSILWHFNKSYPVFISIQGIYSNPNRFTNPNTKKVIHRIKIERKILKEGKYFGLMAPFMIDLIKRDNTTFLPLLCYYPVSQNITDFINGGKVQKKYDFVFFGRVAPEKGIEELIDAMSIVKNTHPKASLNIIGSGATSYISFLKNKIDLLKLNENIHFSGFYPTQKELFNAVIQSKYYVLPTRLEHHALSILEATQLNLPIISCNTGGIPFLNKDKERVLLSNTHDAKGLSVNMMRIMEEPELADKLAIEARQFVNTVFTPSEVTNLYISLYHEIINNHKNGTAISNKYIFTPNF